jgi:Cd2+/Zn2+-exporting ATPase
MALPTIAILKRLVFMQHQHIYDADGKQICCTQEEKINACTTTPIKNSPTASACCGCGDNEQNSQSHSDEHEHNHSTDVTSPYLAPASSFSILILGLMLDHAFPQEWFKGSIRLIWYIVAYIPVGLPVLKEAFESVRNGQVFSEFLLMSIATLGAFAIGEYPEGVAVMLFYAVGEAFQMLAVKRAKLNIKTLLDQRPDEVTVLQNGQTITRKAKSVNLDDIIQLKPGEKLGLDGELLSETASFNTAAFTGESKPDTKSKGETVLAGMINLNTVAQVKVTAAYADSKLSKVLALVQDASARKAPTELFIRKFAKIYTPIVAALALAIFLTPYFCVSEYNASEWLYRALVFLVISCPCALVISIPLGYFGGIGAASKNGILVKGGQFMDAVANIQHIVMDKTGTMTEGIFKVQEVNLEPNVNHAELLSFVNALESHSSHPVATAIRNHVGDVNGNIALTNIEETPGHGLRAEINGKELLVGNFKLLDKFSILHNIDTSAMVFTVIAISYDKQFSGYITIADSIKEDASRTIEALKKANIEITMLSGDKQSVVSAVAEKLGIPQAFGDLLPEGKVKQVEAIKAQGKSIAFVGDGVNDAPVIALSDVGIAMGGLGSDATIETADIVIQDDKPSKIPIAINIGKQTKRIVWQNIALAFGVKLIVLILGAGGLATMWEAVFADVGVALLAIMNAIRIQRVKF